MKVIKRSGVPEEMKYDKIKARISMECYGLNPVIDPDTVVQRVVAGIYDGIKTTQLDDLAAETAAGMSGLHPDYSVLAARISVTKLHKETPEKFSEAVELMYGYINPMTGAPAPQVSKELYDVVMANRDKVDGEIINARDSTLQWLGWRTLLKSYLIKQGDAVVERPQYMWMRVAIGIWGDDLDKAFKTYHLMSTHKMTHATPTLFNAGTTSNQLSSCLVKDTIIYTTRGPVKVQDVKVGDEVVTHRNRTRKVYNTMVNKRVEDMYEIETWYGRKLTLTANHPLLLKTDEGEIWKRADEITVNDYVRIANGVLPDSDYYIIDMLDYCDIVLEKNENSWFKVTSIEDDIIKSITEFYFTGSGHKHAVKSHKKHNEVNRFITFDEDFAWLVGYWIGDGCLVDTTRSGLNAINIVMHTNDEHNIERVIGILEAKTGVTHNKHIDESQGLWKIMISSRIVANMFKSLFGQHASNKHLPEFLHRCSDSVFESFVGGLLTADGCITPRSRLTISLKNEHVITSIYHRLCAMGYGCTLFQTPKYEQYGINLAYEGRLAQLTLKRYDDEREHSSSNTKFIQQVDDKKYIRVKSVSVSDRQDEEVYNFSVEDDHSYQANGVIVKNCHLVSVEAHDGPNNGDSIDGIFDTLKDAAILSKYAGGIGVSFENVRGTGSYISSTNGQSNGIVPFIRVYNNMADAIDQGGGKRKGAVAIYMSPTHSDIKAFLNLKKNHGKEEVRARDLFYAMWIPDVFMQQVQVDGDWYLMDPHETPDLRDLVAEEYSRRYWQYVEQGKYTQKVRARDVWNWILDSQIETGMPYMLYKDASNVKSNQKNLGTIHSSNLCTEIIQFSGYDSKGKLHSAVCNLASIAVNQFVTKGTYSHEALWAVAYQTTVNLNRVIDINYYPLESSRYSNMMMRPVGIGIQGLANAFFALDYDFDSEEARKLSDEITETVYHAALTASRDLAKREGPYELFDGSPLSQGLLQFDLWGVKPSSGRYDWDDLRQSIVQHGVRNSQLIAPMPTASTASILGNIEAFEPVYSNMYVRRILAGDIIVVNSHMVDDLSRIGMWNEDVRHSIMAHNGSIQHITDIPERLRRKYRTAFELSMKPIIDMAAGRGAFVDQSMSLNMFVPNPTKKKLSSMHFYSWGGGVTLTDDSEQNVNNGWGQTPERALKTGMYYLRQPSGSDAVKFTIDSTKAVDASGKSEAELALERAISDGYDVCESCSS